MKKILLAASLLFVIQTQGMALDSFNPGEIRSAVRTRIHDHGAGQRWTDSELFKLMTIAQIDIMNHTWALHKSTDFVLVSGTTYYDLPDELIQFKRVTIDHRNIYEKTITSLDGQFRNSRWQETGGTVKNYFMNLALDNQIGFYPFPNSVSSTGTVRIDYISKAINSVADIDIDNVGDSLFNGMNEQFAYYEPLLIDWMCWQIFLIEGDMDRSDRYQAYYESRLKNMMNLVGSRPNYNPGVSGARGP